MQLVFKTHIKTEPTYFIEKILASLVFDLKLGKELYKYIEDTSCFLNVSPDELKSKVIEFSYELKKHTIRKDVKNKWGIGSIINFHAMKDSSPFFCFAPAIMVKRCQKIKLTTTKEGGFRLSIDNEFKSYNVMSLIAKNDGFESVEEMFLFFNGNFEGKIIHWTDLKY